MIESEDERQPFTDGQMAKALGVKRPYITHLRREMGMPDSRERLKQALHRAIGRLPRTGGAGHEERLDLNELASRLGRAGFNVSRYTLRRFLSAYGQGGATPVRSSGSTTTGMERRRDSRGNQAAGGGRAAQGERATRGEQAPQDAFASVIGYDGDLKSCVDLAKAAVLYPPNGLHTLIVGETGVGKNLFAEAMYRFGVESGALKPAAPFVHFNCSDYANNPELLLSQLFGHAKGAYTGAEGEKPGLVERASGGMLFLDEVHRLPPQGQEILFRIIDTGRFRRLGETGVEHNLTIRLVAATTEKPEAMLLDAFRRRIPVFIEIPPLQKRSFHERFHLLSQFFRQEAARVRTRITVTRDALVSLMLYSPKGNVGQLKSDIQVSIAKAFLNSVTDRRDDMRVDVNTLPFEAQKGLVKASSLRYGQDFLAPLTDMVFEVKQGEAQAEPFPGKAPSKAGVEETIYDFIEARWRQLRETNFSEDEIGDLIGHEVERKISASMKRSARVARDDLVKVVGSHLVRSVEEALTLAGPAIAVSNPNLAYYLALHLHASVNRIKQGKPVINPRLNEIRSSYPAEFELARKMLAYIEGSLGVALPEAEAGFVALYLRNASAAQQGPPDVGLVVMTHGRVASSLLEVAHRLMGESDTCCVEMSLDENPEQVIRRATDAVIQANRGSGVLILADMGSLTTFGPVISKSTGIETRTVDRVDSILVMEAMRRIRFSRLSLDELSLQLGEISGGRPAAAERSRRGAVILTVCLTGKGTAEHLKKLLDHTLTDSSVEIRPLGVFGSGDLSQAISRIQAGKDVIAVVGTVDPEYPNVPFISVEEVISGRATRVLQSLIEQRPSPSLQDLFDASLCRAKVNPGTKDEVLRDMCDMLRKAGVVREGFYESVVERESLAPTCMYDPGENPMAIPHPLVSSFTEKSAVAVATLASPVEWGGLVVDLVFLIAYTSRDKVLAETFFHTVLKNEGLLAALRKAKKDSDIFSLLRS
ncbi:MAG: sigma 54-interacting transcriptional regulator [Firmicutes bacterium]|nr:sigma 54-interacting transcriptional regulator [Bacillota bacterium]